MAFIRIVRPQSVTAAVYDAVSEELALHVDLVIKHLQDFRSYKVSIEKAKTVLSFHPADNAKAIVRNLIDNMEKYGDWDNPLYSNIASFKHLESGIETHAMGKVLAR